MTINVNSNIRKRNKQAISDRYKKVDTTVNGDAETPRKRAQRD